MASIVRVENKRGDVSWVARWRDPDGKQKKKSFRRKTDASAFLATVEGDKVRGAYVDPHEPTTLIEYARAWVKTRPHSSDTAKRVAAKIENHIAPSKIGKRRLAAIRPSEVQAFVTDRATALAPSTLRQLMVIVRAVLTSAVHDRLIAASPAIRLTLPPPGSERLIPMTVPEVAALADDVPDRIRAMVITQAGLGLRVGELLGLRVASVNFLGRTVSITEQRDEHGNWVPPKTARSRRTIPLPTVVAEALSAHIAAFPPEPGGPIFAVWRSSYRDALWKARAEIRTHDLRHHYASVLLAAGESVVAVAERLGHDNATLVLRTYGHLLPDSEERTRKAVDEAWAARECSSAIGVPSPGSATS